MADKDQYTNNVNDEWSVKDTEQWISTTTILSIITAFIRYTTKSTYSYFLTAGKNLYYTVANTLMNYKTRPRRR
jgi:hypothetical protein